MNRLKPDEELREKVKGYVDGEIERSKKEEKEEKEEKEKNGENVEEGEGAVEGEAVKVRSEYCGVRRSLTDRLKTVQHHNLKLMGLNPLIVPKTT